MDSMPDPFNEPIGPPYQHYISSAMGWIELGMPKEAQAELKRIPKPLQDHPEVLMVRWELHAKLQQWQQALQVARSLVQSTPSDPESWIKQSFCLHELKRTQEAWDCLHSVQQEFENSPTIAYNLACYACQLGEFESARAWLQHAKRVGDLWAILEMAATDPDLSPMRDSLATL